MKAQITKNLENAIRTDFKNSKCHRDLIYSILGNFSTEEIISHLLTHRKTQKELIGLISNYQY